MPQINIPRFVFGDNSGQGVGQGEGEAGDPGAAGTRKDGQSGQGEAGEGEGSKALEVEVSLDELAEIMGEELGCRTSSPRHAVARDQEGPLRRPAQYRAPRVAAHFKATFKRALRRQVSMGTYDPRPGDRPDPRGPRYRSWRTDPRRSPTRSSST
jgi:hypothetical protein